MGLGLVAKMSEHEAFRPVSTIRIVIIVAMTCILIVGIFASLVLAKVGCRNLELVFQRTLGLHCLL
jgi:phosphotransferase system  glucose/maltose/N-acetylglucosamine-specific IIC component